MIAGAVASSAPVQPELNFVEYYEVVETSLTLQSKQAALCPIAIMNANAILYGMVHNRSQLSTVETKFK